MTSKTKWKISILASLVVLFLLALGYAYFIEPTRLVLNRQTLMVTGWDPLLNGLKIVAIGDIHGGSNAVDKAKLRQIVQLTNAQEPDLVVLLGDFVSQSRGAPLGDRNIKMPMQTIAENLAGIKAKYGVLAVMGNQDDWYSNGEVTMELRAVGYNVLDNQIYTVETTGGQKLRILGLRDHLQIHNWKTFSDDLKRIVEADAGTGLIHTVVRSGCR
jgi:predicted MPP superfamily phosphohydrolase